MLLLLPESDGTAWQSGCACLMSRRQSCQVAQLNGRAVLLLQARQGKKNLSVWHLTLLLLLFCKH